MAEITNVTKRTIDYYTRLGLLKAERSASNYRYYDHSSIERVNYIEKRKREGLSLEEIKREISDFNAEEIDLLELKFKMKDLEKEVFNILANFKNTDQEKFRELKGELSDESFSLIQTLLGLVR